jgi:16S rRNA (uracil1498-N3)-methyltransferase
MAEKRIRILVEQRLGSGAAIEATPEQANYLLNVMRLRTGDCILVFNGRDGEWLARVAVAGKRSCRMEAIEEMRAQTIGPDIHYLFAPLKRARLDYMVQKATELGVSRLQPVVTARTQAERVNVERMRANVVEAAEQCGVLTIPETAEPLKLEKAVGALEPGRRLILCDEEAPVASPLAALGGLAPGPVAVLIGPEGGFSPDERAMLLRRPSVTAISLGPRIMRADTAAVAALALVNAVLGDWR